MDPAEATPAPSAEALDPDGANPDAANLDANELWKAILRRAAESVGEHKYAAWLSKLMVLSWSDGVLRLEHNDPFHAEWVEDKLAGLLQELGEQVVGRPFRLRVTSSNTTRERLPEVKVSPVALPPPDDGSAWKPPAYLNRRYTFDRFVVGENNRLAQAGSVAVAERPAMAYNPLFLYGPTGLGKTHLMQAIANQILESASGEKPRVCYVPAEQFMNEMVTAIQKSTMEAFRARYRSYELLLVDDIQFLRKKERTQEEFFHTFNALHHSGCQIVLTSDRKPEELEGLEERLTSRFEWGLVADVSRPSYETRVAILQKKAEEDRVLLDPDILDLVARRCRSSVRELEGAIIKLLAFSSLTNQDLTLDMARLALVNAGRESPAEEASETTPSAAVSGAASPAPEAIRDAVAAAFGLPVDVLVSRTRTRQVVVPRQVAMLLIRDVLDVSLCRIGETFDRHHSTVLHSLQKAQDQIDDDAELRTKVEALAEELRKALAEHLRRTE